PVVFVGDAVAPYAPVLGEVLGADARLAPADLRLPSAVTVGELGGWALDHGAGSDPTSLVPLYLRPSAAQLAHERRQRAGHPNGADAGRRPRGGSPHRARVLPHAVVPAGFPARAGAKPGRRALGSASRALRRSGDGGGLPLPLGGRRRGPRDESGCRPSLA